MKLHWSPRSPFVRKVMVVAQERGIVDRLELVRSVAITTRPNPALMADNPLNKIPALVLDDGRVLQDSRVICEYLDALAPGASLFPTGDARWNALRSQALADGMLDLAVIWRGERSRGDAASQPHLQAFATKMTASLDRIEREGLGHAFDIGGVAMACMLAYLDFRFADLQWRDDRPGVAAWFERAAARPSMLRTEVFDDEGSA